MAEVLAPIVQPSTTMLHSSPDAFKSGPSSHQTSRSHPMANHVYNAQRGGIAYRGPSASPVAPYAFQTTPHLRKDNRTVSAPVGTSGPGFKPGHQSSRSGPASTSSTSSASTASSSSTSITGRQASKDDTMVPSGGMLSKLGDGSSFLNSSAPDLSLSLQLGDSPAKTTADRYRRHQRRPETSPLGEAKPAVQNVAVPLNKDPILLPSVFNPNVPANHTRAGSADETIQNRPTGSSELAKRYRRRSLGNLESTLASEPLAGLQPAGSPRHNLSTAAGAPVRPSSSQERSPSTSSMHTPIQRPSSARNESYNAPRPSMFTVTQPQHQPRSGHRIPSDGSKRLAAPSPLAKPLLADDESPSKPTSPQPSTAAPSPAVQQLNAVNAKGLNKGMKHRLRRALSFSSAAELKKTASMNATAAAATMDAIHTGAENMEAQDREAVIVAQQEAAGIGASIYSGQGNVFSGSTDNLSVSSTASSASVMLRKMGRGMRKSTRSLKAIFRPKSVIGVPAADAGTSELSAAEVSMVNVEAEREQMNVNADPREQPGGGSGFPKLDVNFGDTASLAPSSSHGSVAGSDSRKTILGGEHERQQILAAVAKKGILKRPGSTNSSPIVGPVDAPPAYNAAEAPAYSSGPGTPVDEKSRIEKMEAPDYFMGAPRFAPTGAKSMPNTPSGSMRNISFSPRIQFHDVWSATDYDRRGDIATCNKLTPMLAQQIKEELNTFKMEMEVHELSKPHTHFF